MFAWNNWHRSAVLTAFVCALALAGCGEKKTDAPKAGDDPKPAEVAKDKKKDGDITMDDLRKAAEAAGGNFDPNKAPPKKQPESLAKVKPDVVLTANECREEFNKDVRFLSKKYPDKVVEVTGTVDYYREGAPGVAYLLLRAGKRKLIDAFRCDVREKDLEKKVLPSQTAVLRTRVLKADTSPVVIWELIEAKGTITTLTAEQFAQEKAVTEEDELNKKYDEKHLIVTGVIAKVVTEDQGTRIFLVGVGETQVVCWFPKDANIPVSQQQKDSLKPGQTVKVFGEYFSRILKDCILLEPAR